jgi:hypothetical protein
MEDTTMRILILDDNLDRHNGFRKALSDHVLTHVYTHNQAVKALEDNPAFDLVYLDHDIGDLQDGDKDDYGRDLTGHDVALFMVRVLDATKLPEEVIIHSWNPVGARSMLQVLQPVVQVSCQPYTAPDDACQGAAKVQFK